MKYLILTILSISFFYTSCSTKNGVDENNQKSTSSDSTYAIRYARGFSVKIFNDYKEISVRDPWDTTKVLQKYILADKSKPIPPNLPEGNLIRTPLEKVVAYSTIHSSTLNELKKLNTIKGVCEPEYISIPYIQEGIKNGTIVDLGQASNPNTEKIIDIDPEAIWATPINGQSYGNAAKIGIPIIETPDYMEPTPLGRAEWLRFYSLFYNNETYADSLFNITVNNYNKIKEKTISAKTKPSVFIDLMYRGVWYISGGDSFIAHMFSDAGAKYVWYGNHKIDSAPYTFEQVLDEASDAQFWLIKYNKPTDLTYPKLEEEYKPYSYFDAFKNRNIYECNTNYRKYYEDLPIHPDYILENLAYIFHPDLFPDYVPRYYNKMKE